jgi:Domain of unknown function (DUF1707)
MVGPGDESVAGAGRHSLLRASHADREQVLDMVKAAFVQGRLAKDEFDVRVARVLAARTYADLNALTADMPAGLAKAQPPGAAPEVRSGPAPESTERKIVKAWACATVVLPSIAVGVALLESGTAIAYIAIAMALFACVVAVPVSGLLMLHSWIEEHFRKAWDDPDCRAPEVSG